MTTIVKNKYGDEMLKLTKNDGTDLYMKKFDKAQYHQPCAVCGEDVHGQTIWYHKDLRIRHTACQDKPVNPAIPVWYPREPQQIRRTAAQFGDEEFEALVDALKIEQRFR